MHIYFPVTYSYIHNLVFTTKTPTLAGARPVLAYKSTSLSSKSVMMCYHNVTLFILPDLMVKHYFIFFVFTKQTMSQVRQHSLNFHLPVYLSTSIFVLGNLCSMDRDSVVTKATHYRLDSLGIIPVEARFSSPIQTCHGAHPVFHSGYQVIPRGKVARVWHQSSTPY
jgi:hypothetical protein